MAKGKYVITREKAKTLRELGIEPAINQTSVEAAIELARVFGALGGAATKGISTPKKRRASKENGKLGGRPKGSKTKKVSPAGGR